MSRNSKNARNLTLARQHSATRKSGGRGPAKTTPQHGKRWGYRTNPETQKRLAEAIKAMDAPRTGARTSGRKILENAGGAAE